MKLEDIETAAYNGAKRAVETLPERVSSLEDWRVRQDDTQAPCKQMAKHEAGGLHKRLTVGTLLWGAGVIVAIAVALIALIKEAL